MAEVCELAGKQNRTTAVNTIDGEPQPSTAIWAPGRIYFDKTNGVVVGAEFPCGVDFDH